MDRMNHTTIVNEWETLKSTLSPWISHPKSLPLMAGGAQGTQKSMVLFPMSRHHDKARNKY